MQKRYVRLKDWIQIKISGRDTIPYLNGIITKDLNKLNDGEIARSAFLTPKAHIRSVYWLKKQNGDVTIYCPAEMKQDLVEDLLKYKLSMDVKLEDITDEVPPLYLIEASSIIPGLVLNDTGFNFINTNNSPEGLEISYSDFVSLLIEHGVVPPEVMKDQNPYEIGIQDAISLEKGCFLGQEPISRMYHRGNPRKFVYMIQGESINMGDELVDGEETVGTILAVSGSTALAYIRRGTENMESLKTSQKPISVIARVGSYPDNER